MVVQYKTPEIPRLVPKPQQTQGLAQPVLCLDGLWHWQETDDFAAAVAQTDFDSWPTVQVPGHVGLGREENNRLQRYVYKTAVALPQDWNEAAKVLRFEGINGTADVYLDGVHLGTHENGFITFNYDVTQIIKQKRHCVITVTVDETLDTVSTFSHGGILHSVFLLGLPAGYVSSLHTTTTFDNAFVDAVLRVDAAFGGVLPKEAALHLTLLDPQGNSVAEQTHCLAACSKDSWYCEIAVPKAQHWDAEHPRLYTLRLSLYDGAQLQQSLTHQVGFRQLHRKKNRVFVNDKEIKLRGVCRHETTALTGRSLTVEQIREDVALFKEANCNYIRTSHYPPSEAFLHECDAQGIYVEDELALAFIARTLEYTQQDPACAERYLSHFTEVLARDYSHPSVIIWSLCNESFGGYNFDLLNRYAKAADPTRFTKFSYPMTCAQQYEPVDIWSIHYANYYDDLAAQRDNVSVKGDFAFDLPVLHDEYAHIPCYNRTEHRRDPNVRNFWGESIKRFWDHIWNTPGALGGAIWAGIDETDVFTGGNARLEWGIIDTWRRRKPEFYCTRKAYSPVRVTGDTFACDASGRVTLAIENRFCHTDLQEVTLRVTQNTHTQTLCLPIAAPRQTAQISFAVSQPNEPLALAFFDSNGAQVDEYVLAPSDAVQAVVQTPAGTALQYEKADDRLTIKGSVKTDAFVLVWNSKTGQIETAMQNGHTVLEGGPMLHTPYLRLPPWQCTAFSADCLPDCCTVTINGCYGDAAAVAFTVTLQNSGVLKTQVAVTKLCAVLPQPVKLRVGVDEGGLDELGIAFMASAQTECLSWKRAGLWNSYPQDHIARLEGKAYRYSEGSIFGQKPVIAWKDETKNYILNGRYDVDYKGTADFRTLRDKIQWLALSSANEQAPLTVLSDGSHSVRVCVEDPQALCVPCNSQGLQVAGTWHLQADTFGASNGVELWSNEAGASITLPFVGTGAVWYGPVDVICGKANVFLDDVCVAQINQRVDGVDFPGSCAGYDKKYDYPVFSVQDLPHGAHTLRIEVLGEKVSDAADCYIAVDRFRIFDGSNSERVMLYVLKDYNYPHIAWGNYTKPPITLHKGDICTATLSLVPQ